METDGSRGKSGRVPLWGSPAAPPISIPSLQAQAAAVGLVFPSGRFSMVVEDGVVKSLNVEPDGTGLTCSLASNIISQL